MKRLGLSIFVSLWCKKCKKKEAHVMTDSENPGSTDVSAALTFECQECGEKKKVYSFEAI